MSEDIYDGTGIQVTVYAGPEGDHATDRRMWQFGIVNGMNYTSLDAEEVRALIAALESSL